MPLPDNFPRDPFAIAPPDSRWRPATDSGGMVLAERDPAFGSLLPPLADKIRREVAAWRESGYAGASATTRALLDWWFNRPHMGADGESFQYYFAQREAVESVIWLHELARIRNSLALAPYDSSGRIRTGDLREDWPRFVVKMATGSGKTKTMSLLAAWSYFHKSYEKDSELSQNILLVAPNIIVFDRLRRDFEGLRIFHEDPVLPENGFAERNWRSDFQLRVHKQDEVSATGTVRNLFLTNIHRVFMSAPALTSADDEDTRAHFLGPRPVGATTDSKVDLGAIVRDLDELLVINDEAHHIHDSEMAWAKSIEDIHNRMVQRGRTLSLQLDFTATPKHDNGAIFPQTISDYPLAEAVFQRVVKRPVIPDRESAELLIEHPDPAYSKRFADHIRLGVEEWRKARKECAKEDGKKALLFVMTEDTKTCDEVAAHLESAFPELSGRVLVIHTKNNGEIAEKGKARDLEELRKLREQANSIDGAESPYLAVVSVLMLREGWDVRNVTTIVGLRPYESKSKILPEQTLGRGLRLMFPDADGDEKLSVIGTDAFMDFVREVEKEGVELESVSMGERTPPQTPMIVQVERGNPDKDIAALDIEIPRLSPRLIRDYERAGELNPAEFKHAKALLREFPADAPRDIVFRDILTDEVSHRTRLDDAADLEESRVVGYFAQMAMRRLRLFSGYDVICAKMREFLSGHFFAGPADLTDANVLRNLALKEAGAAALDSFCGGVNAALFSDRVGELEVRGVIRVSGAKSFAVRWRENIQPRKSVFNRIVGDLALELRFAKFLDRCPDIASFAKNYMAVGFRLEYVKADGELSNYYPDFLVKLPDGTVYVVETKGQQNVDDSRKFARLVQWCDDVNARGGARFHPLFVPEDGFNNAVPKTFAQLVALFANAKPYSAA